MKCLKGQEESTTVDGAQVLPSNLAKHDVLPTSDNCTSTLHRDVASVQQIEVGSVYEIDRTNFPPRTPLQLRSIRVVMVSEKTELNVSVRFPSVESLGIYFSNSFREMYPALDEKFVMGTQLAAKVLVRQVPTTEFAEKKHLEGFWLVNSSSAGGGSGDVTSKKGRFLSDQIRCHGLVSWGARRQVKYLGKHIDKSISNPQSSSSFVKGQHKEKQEEVDEDDDENEEEDDEEEEVSEEAHETVKCLKRKKYNIRCVQNTKKAKQEKQRQRQKKTKVKNRRKELLVLKDPKNRWSTERYKLAEKNLLEVMKAKGAVFGNPIQRPDLRAEARKRIGDTGLLDHLLKHMAGKIAPGGIERFRRRHNADGVMEYWLERADLVNIRQEAGVQDPYWTPPPGWKPGDCPTQDPICAGELKLMKEEISKIKRDMEELVPKKQFEEEMAKLRREMEALVSRQKHEECQAIEVENSLVSWKSDHDDGVLVTLAEKYKKHLKVFKDTLRGMEEEVEKLTSRVEERTRSESAALKASTESPTDKGKKQLEGSGKEPAAEVLSQMAHEKSEGDQREARKIGTAAEEKAAKIQRLKSGFRICKPQGTFLWPNMSPDNINGNNSNMLSPQAVVHVEDLFVVPTPPSVSSSTSTAPPQLPYHRRNQNPASPVKPVAERRAVKVRVSTVATGPSQEEQDINYSITSTGNSKNTTLINLNDAPVTSTVYPQMLQSSRINREMSPWDVIGTSANSNKGGKTTEASRDMVVNNQQQQQQQKRYSTSSSSSVLPAGAGSWLALATPTPPAFGDSKSGRKWGF